MRFPIRAAAHAAALSAPAARNCGDIPPNNTLPTPTPTPTPLPGAPDVSFSRLLMSTAGRVIVADVTANGLAPSIDEAVIGDPSWMAYAEPGLLYAVDEWSSAVRLFNLDLAAGTLDLVAERNASAGVVHLELNPAGTRMVGAAYGNGTIDVWNTEAGGLELLKTVVSDGELGPNAERQAAAHPHQAVNDPTGRYFAVNDLGTDEVLVLDSQDDSFDIVSRVRVEPAGCGPRHGAFYPSVGEATHYLVVCEMLNEVVVYGVAYAPAGGLDFTRLSSASTFDPANPPAGAATAAAGELVVAAPDDVYVSNRLTGEATDSIAHLKLSPADGSLTFRGEYSSGGLLPRMMSLADSGREMLVATQDGPLGVSVLRRDDVTGRLAGPPVASMDAAVFGEKGAGPKYIVQVA
jgi:6-phosphogluconolactonase (cycloisomerase 2 family)